MRDVLFESDFYRLERLAPGLLCIYRKARPFESVEDVSTACDPLQQRLDLMGRRRHALLIDSRDAVGRNDAESESMFEAHRRAMLVGFSRVAVLVKSPAGRLQTARLLSSDRGDARVYADEAEAIAFLLSPDPSP